ncbi:tetratricopeptide repeat protein [Parasedimentitalea huanghaiensis]|uniref:Tetratricopeptide repeat protein n=1 Tax=Parasedimentitalea huanghaiensis TaxID=2682100 RepID=A0A6L6WB11_9RHOB|nr:tetratricopeptide repeat protein [Zongyanglinia huanghaiensis]MVO14448.1 tetratricopeptide repeat protein [Zongyanglinia huanghaiensis]
MSDYYDLGNYTCPITSTSNHAQLWFDRGLVWTYAYNHQEAVVCFQRALEHDPNCAMAHWGVAFASGPNYNMPWELHDVPGREKALSTAFDAAQLAVSHVDGVTKPEAALINALAARYPQRELIDDMHAWDFSFADAMRAAFAECPDHLDLRTIYAESLLNLTPWKMWDLKTGQPAEGAATLETQEVLEWAMSHAPGAMQHPGLLHLYVHLMEMSPCPEKALKAGDVLRTLVPDAGHLVHMPTHIDVLCGDYKDVVHWNEKAVEADIKYYHREGAYNIYTGYRQHNYHFIIYGAMFLGQYEPARRANLGMWETVPEDMLRIESPPMADYFESYMAMGPHILIRFGRWDEAMALELPKDPDLYRTLTATTHYARAIGFAATGRVIEAETEEVLFQAAKARIPETRLMHNNRVIDLIEIAAEMLRGEIEYRKENYDVAFAHLRRSVELDDNLPYDEPWGWMQPTRHALGALLFEQGHVAQAEAVYREDLGLGGSLSRASIHPSNVWSLKGLHDCLKARGETTEIKHVKHNLDLAMARADRVAASCACAQVAMKENE